MGLQIFKRKTVSRGEALLLTFGSVLLLLAFTALIEEEPGVAVVVPSREEAVSTKSNLTIEGVKEHVQEEKTRLHFDQAVMMLHAREYQHAVTALHQVLLLTPRMPEAHVNMGFALLGQLKTSAARDFFLSAIELNPQQLNAYYGLGLAEAQMGNFQSAVGAMESYLHFADAEDAYRDRARLSLESWYGELNSQNQ